MTDSSRRLKDLTNEQLKKLHHASQGGYKKVGYDDSADTQVDWDGPTTKELREANKIQLSHYDPSESSMEWRADEKTKTPQWGVVRDMLGLKSVNSEADLQSMFREVNNEYSARQIDKATGKLEERIAALEAGAGDKAEEETKETAPPPEFSEKTKQAQDFLKNYERSGPSYSPGVGNFMEPNKSFKDPNSPFSDAKPNNTTHGTIINDDASYFQGAKEEMKARLKEAGVTTRGAGSPLFGTGNISFDFDAPKQTDNTQQKDPPLENKSVNDFANEYKLNIADDLLPTNRGGQY